MIFFTVMVSSEGLLTAPHHHTKNHVAKPLLRTYCKIHKLANGFEVEPHTLITLPIRVSETHNRNTSTGASNSLFLDPYLIHILPKFNVAVYGGTLPDTFTAVSALRIFAGTSTVVETVTSAAAHLHWTDRFGCVGYVFLPGTVRGQVWLCQAGEMLCSRQYSSGSTLQVCQANGNTLVSGVVGLKRNVDIRKELACNTTRPTTARTKPKHR